MISLPLRLCETTSAETSAGHQWRAERYLAASASISTSAARYLYRFSRKLFNLNNVTLGNFILLAAGLITANISVSCPYRELRVLMLNSKHSRRGVLSVKRGWNVKEK